jgi:2-iminobutanoate/2-iminopropanoate deaminase
MIRKRCITSQNGPPAAGPYSHAVAAGHLLFVSGQGAVSPRDGKIRNDTFEKEVRQTLQNVKAVLEDAGSGLQYVVKTTVYLSDMNHFAEMNRIYKEYFPSDPPARTTVEVARLPLDFRVEIEVIALLPE